MPESNKPPSQPPLASIEADLFGAIFGFHKKTLTLLRESSLNGDKLKLVSERIKTLLDAATAEMNRTQQLDLVQRLDAAYDEVKRFVDELSGPPAGGKATG